MGGIPADGRWGGPHRSGNRRGPALSRLGISHWTPGGEGGSQTFTQTASPGAGDSPPRGSGVQASRPCQGSQQRCLGTSHGAQAASRWPRDLGQMTQAPRAESAPLGEDPRLASRTGWSAAHAPGWNEWALLCSQHPLMGRLEHHASQGTILLAIGAGGMAGGGTRRRPELLLAAHVSLTSAEAEVWAVHVMGPHQPRQLRECQSHRKLLESRLATREP